MAKKGLKSEDRPDVITRVLKIKLDSLMTKLKDQRTFGRVKGGNLHTHRSNFIQSRFCLICYLITKSHPFFLIGSRLHH